MSNKIDTLLLNIQTIVSPYISSNVSHFPIDKNRFINQKFTNLEKAIYYSNNEKEYYIAKKIIELASVPPFAALQCKSVTNYFLPNSTSSFSSDQANKYLKLLEWNKYFGNIVIAGDLNSTTCNYIACSNYKSVNDYYSFIFSYPVLILTSAIDI